jgi:hypothetical protein
VGGISRVCILQLGTDGGTSAGAQGHCLGVGELASCACPHDATSPFHKQGPWLPGLLLCSVSGGLQAKVMAACWGCSEWLAAQHCW